MVETFAGMVPFPDVMFRWKMLLLLALNCLAAYVADQVAIWVYENSKGKRILGITIT